MPLTGTVAATLARQAGGAVGRTGAGAGDGAGAGALF